MNQTSTTRSRFNVVTHEIPCQHIRQDQPAVAYKQEDVPNLEIQQYIPLNNPHPQLGDVTILVAHANAIPNETYEPLWTHLLDESKRHGYRIRAIRVADLSHQAQSGRFNQAGDLLHLILEVKRQELLNPFVSIGHGVEGSQLVGVGGVGHLREGGVGGGVKRGATLIGLGHLPPLGAPGLTAKEAAVWIGSEVKRFRAEKVEYKRLLWKTLSLVGLQAIHDQWKRATGGMGRRPAKPPPCGKKDEQAKL